MSGAIIDVVVVLVTEMVEDDIVPDSVVAVEVVKNVAVDIDDTASVALDVTVLDLEVDDKIVVLFEFFCTVEDVVVELLT